MPDGAATVILDERGENMSSAHIAGRLQDWRRQDAPAVVFIIGAADGLAPSLREKASLAIAFGGATWPHQLIRIMLLEQLYRAVTIHGELTRGAAAGSRAGGEHRRVGAARRGGDFLYRSMLEVAHDRLDTRGTDVTGMLALGNRGAGEGRRPL